MRHFIVLKQARNSQVNRVGDKKKRHNRSVEFSASEPLPQTDEWLVNYYVEHVNELHFYPEPLFASARLNILATGICQRSL